MLWFSQFEFIRRTPSSTHRQMVSVSQWDEFAAGLSDAEQQKAALENITARIDRYVDTENIAPKPKSTASVNKILARTEFKSMKDALESVLAK
jgi:hypothetical protein